MSGFVGSLVVTPKDDGKTWVLLQSFGYETRKVKNIDVEVGFMTDFASIPRLLWFILPRWGKYGKASVIHDWLYWTHEVENHRVADRIMLEAMGNLSVPAWKKYIIFWSVYLFGFISWNRNAWDRAAGFNRVIPNNQITSIEQSGRVGLIKRTWQHYLRPMKKERVGKSDDK